ncbi:MAG: hypothetical protein ACK4FL_03615 [Microgenomates group bacterium]
MSFKKIFFIFFLFRLFDFLILFFAPRFLPYRGFFPYKEVLANYHLPSWITSLANFDGVHYLLIAQQGYSQYEQAFFPLYPLLIKITAPIFFSNSLIAGLFISNLSFLLGLYFFSQLLKIYRITNNEYLITILLLFPTSFFFGALYTEGLFFFLISASLYFLKKKKYFAASFFAFFASLTRVIGVFLIIPFVFHFCRKRHNNLNNLRGYLKPNFLISQFLNFLKFLISNIQYPISLFSPLLGFSFYSLYLWQTTGDPLFFLTSQPVFGANRSTKLILLPQVFWRYLKIFFTASFNFQYFVSLFEFFIFNFVFVILILDLLKNIKIKFYPNIEYRISNIDLTAVNIFSLANLLLPTLTGTFSSLPRYSLFSLSFFIYLSQIKNKLIKISIILVFLIFHLITLAFFGQGYFIS